LKDGTLLLARPVEDRKSLCQLSSKRFEDNWHRDLVSPTSQRLPAIYFRCGFGPYKIFFHFKAFVHESILLCFPSPTCIAHTIAILGHGCFAIEYPPPTLFLNAIRHTILVMAISCKGQVCPRTISSAVSELSVGTRC